MCAHSHSSSRTCSKCSRYDEQERRHKAWMYKRFLSSLFHVQQGIVMRLYISLAGGYLTQTSVWLVRLPSFALLSVHGTPNSWIKTNGSSKLRSNGHERDVVAKSAKSLAGETSDSRPDNTWLKPGRY